MREYSRGIAGGLLFSFPLLYTMEVWWTGFIAPPQSLLILVIVTFFLLMGYNRYAGMHPDATWPEVVVDSVEELGIGFIISFSMLLMLNRIQLEAVELNELMGKVIVEAMAVSIGVSVGTAQLGTNEDDEEVNNGKKEPSNRNKVALSVMALCGAIIVGGNVAPTEEVIQIAVESKPMHILVMAFISIALSVVVVYFSNFKGTESHKPDNLLYEITFDTTLCYLIALGVSAFLLWFFDRLDNMSFWYALAQCIVLGVLASLGSSAGRLLIK